MASRFWVGGAGTWDNSDTTHWAATTGGAGGQSVPSTADTVTFDGSSGGGTVVVAATINGTNTIISLTCGAFTGTLDFATNNPSITFSLASSPGFSISGSGTRTINLGSGTFTVSGNNGSTFDAATTTGLTFNAGTSTIVINTPTNGNIQTFASGSLTYSTVSFGARNSSGSVITTTGSPTIGTFNINEPCFVQFGNSTTTTVTNPVAWDGSAANQLVLMNGGSDSQAVLSLASGSTISWATLRGLNIDGTAAPLTATNSFDLKRNTDLTITAPSVGGGGARVIGG